MALDFLEFRLDPGAGTLCGPDGPVRLRPKTYQLLLLLVRRAPAVVPKADLLDAVWGQEHLGETSLAQAVSELRRALGDDPRCPRAIETLHRRGYRFVAPLAEAADGGEPNGASAGKGIGGPADRPAPTDTATHPAGTRPRRAAPALIVAAALALLVLGRLTTAGPAAGERDEQGRPPRIAVLPFDLEPADGGGPAPWLADGLPYLLIHRLGSADGLYAYPLDRVEAALADLAPPAGNGVPAATLAHYLRADRLLRGRIRPATGGALEVELELLDARGDGEALGPVDRFRLDDLGWQLHRWVRRIRGQVGPPTEEPVRGRARPGLRIAALERFFTARSLMTRDPRAAVEIFRRSSRRQPRAAAAGLARSRYLWRLGATQDARRTARDAARHSRELAHELWYLAVHGRIAEAVDLLAGWPGPERLDPELWLDVMEVAGEPSTVLAAADRLPRAVRHSWLEAELARLEKRAAERLGDGRRARRAARRQLLASQERRAVPGPSSPWFQAFLSLTE